MKKQELVAQIAADAGISKAQAERALGAFTDAVTTTLKKKDKLTLVGFGTFEASDRKARTARNPRTGASINVPASTVPRFKAGKALKAAVNK
ncbi:MAG: HU family DNA-binding protein [Candidatus Marinimicrobia bacterium]|nr:HU family DNA-binding protein [Candidatus Neomarinimicrobiota bacterium]MCF7840004.1 HU family DNA-binding protein [Candidatus Neomarinimicrobiota bacterium]